MIMHSADRESGVGGGEVDVDVSSLQDDVAVPRRNGEVVFESPWQSRAFGMAVALCRDGYFEWDDFRANLARAIVDRGQDGVDDYYLRWLDALEASLSGRGLYQRAELEAREHEYHVHARDEVF
ncbi:hypothetical protein GCM10023350_00330 [Nocardioides endophyticus]|uniref:Nitrile hydratase beta subunit-like N-terminal domain-containing protein n=1 Tax=Nocardioides endophyticus TaxID=1353775 RepID=A0ABP8Y7H6_9ACTN